MRYIKVLFLVVIFFLALVFFFQNQVALSQQIELTLNLFFIPPMTSIPLPFYFLILASFFVGAILSLIFLVWDKVNTSAKLVKAKWRISSLEKSNNRLQQQTAAPVSSAAAKADVPSSKEISSPKPAKSKPE